MTGDDAERTREWRIAIGAIFALLLAVAVAGVVTLLFTRNVADVTAQALRSDVPLEDTGDELRAAVLDVRHFHRNLVFDEVSEAAITDLETAHVELLLQIEELRKLDIQDPSILPDEELKRRAEEYYADFRPAIDVARSDPAAFDEASERGLARIEVLEAAAHDIDRLGERRATQSLASVDQASATATVVLIAVIGALGLTATLVSVTALRVLAELRRLNATERHAKEQLAVALRAKTDFIADASHELRTPLAVLRGNAELGLSLDASSAQGELLTEVVAEAERLSRIVDDLFLLARSDAETLQLDVAPIEIEPWLADLATRAEFLVLNQGGSLALDLEANGRLEGDVTRLDQAVLALVDNASKYGGGAGPVTLCASSESGALRIEVADRGPGIPDAEQTRVFERFYRLDKTEVRSREGAGLGLAIAKAIVDAHGGTIGAVSRGGEGTTMTIELALVQPGKATVAAGAAQTRAAGRPV